MSDDDDKKRNPWGDPVHQGPWSGSKKSTSSGGDGGGEPPNLDDLLRAAKESLGDNMGDGKNTVKIAIIVLIVAIIAWLASGFYTVKPGENAVVQRFGALERIQKMEGLSYRIPWPIESVKKINVSKLKGLNIGFSKLRDGTKRSIPEESLVLTSDKKIVEIFLVVQWIIKSPDDYLFKIADPKGTLKKVSESAMREVAGQTNMSPLMKNRDAVSHSIKQIIQSNLDEYSSGILIKSVSLDKIEVHPDVQDAFQDVQSAKQNAENRQNLAAAYSNDVIPKARGKAFQKTESAKAYSDSVIEKAKGDASRFDEVYSAYIKGKDVTKARIYIETMENVIKNADTIILDDSNGNGTLPYLSLDKVEKKGAGK